MSLGLADRALHGTQRKQFDLMALAFCLIGNMARGYRRVSQGLPGFLDQLTLSLACSRWQHGLGLWILQHRIMLSLRALWATCTVSST